MNWTVAELLYELDQDPKRRIVFVEGQRDLIFWRRLIPTLERNNAVIYPISVMVCDAVLGGERGRLLWLAELFSQQRAADRALFFADDDYSSILGATHPANVVVTDCRDIECYGLTSSCLANLAITGFQNSDHRAAEILPWVSGILRQIGLIRICSLRQDLRLRFQRTLEKGISRYLVGSDLSATLNVNRLLTALLQNSDISVTRVSEIDSLIGKETENQSIACDSKIAHGKDFVRVLAWLFDIPEKSAAAMLFLSMDYSAILQQDNIRSVRDWVCTTETEADRSAAFVSDAKTSIAPSELAVEIAAEVG